MRFRFAIFVLWVGTLGASPVPAAEPASGEERPTPEQRVQQAFSDAALSRQLLMVVGNGVGWAGDPALLAGEWLGLACTPACALLPARVTINPPTDESGGVPVLRFTVDEGDAASVHAWLAVDPERAWLRAGPVVQHPFAARRDTPGSFEQAVETPAAGGAQLRAPDRRLAGAALHRGKTPYWSCTCNCGKPAADSCCPATWPYAPTCRWPITCDGLAISTATDAPTIWFASATTAVSSTCTCPARPPTDPWSASPPARWLSRAMRRSASTEDPRAPPPPFFPRRPTLPGCCRSAACSATGDRDCGRVEGHRGARAAPTISFRDDQSCQAVVGALRAARQAIGIAAGLKGIAAHAPLLQFPSATTNLARLL